MKLFFVIFIVPVSFAGFAVLVWTIQERRLARNRLESIRLPKIEYLPCEICGSEVPLSCGHPRLVKRL